MTEFWGVSAFLLFAFGCMTALGAVCSRIWRRTEAPHWTAALQALPVPTDVGKKSGWRVSHFRDAPGGKLLNCQLNYTEHGVLMRELLAGVSFLYLLHWRHTLFIPWTAFSNPRPVVLSWLVTLVDRQRVELDVAGQPFSVVVNARVMHELGVGEAFWPVWKEVGVWDDAEE